MNSRTLINLILFITLIVFISFYYNNKNQSVETKRLTNLSLDNISTIRIPRTDSNDIVLQKNTTEQLWYMTEPYSIKAHQFRVNTLLSLSQTPINEAYDSTTLNLSHYALDKPRANIFFDTTKISFGKTNPINNKRYLLSNNQLVLLEDQTYPLISSQAATFVNLKLVEKGNITALELPKYSINKNNSGVWQSTLKSTTKKNINADQLQLLLQNWAHAQAFAVHRYLPRKDLGVINLNIGDDRIKFIISDNDPWLILARPDIGIEYHLDVSQIQSLIDPLSTQADSDKSETTLPTTNRQKLREEDNA